ncbi:oligosaccharide flippase family protein, partial [bacterium]|nr:oligosaccharide flippase family protein [bacterium]
MNLLNTSIYTGIATLIRIVTGFVLNKIIALYVGPSGLAFFGQFQNFVTIILSFASGGISTGVVKYTSENAKHLETRNKLFYTSMCITIVCVIPVATFLFFLSKQLSIKIFKTPEYEIVFQIFGVSIFLLVLNELLMSILNGMRDIKSYTIINVS